MHTKFWSENLKGGDHSEDLQAKGNMILNGSQGNITGKCGQDSSGPGQRPVACSCGHSNELRDS